MKFTKEQQDFIKQCGEHFEVLTGGRGHSKTKEVIEDMQNEIERLNNIINKAKMYCEDVIQEHENSEYDVDTVWLAIKEHKGNIKSVLNILNGDLENYWRGDK